MGPSALFELEKISCHYGAQEVLRIDRLDIPKVPLTFVLGASGIGKSTLLEMLGLMSNTHLGSGTRFNYNSEVDLLPFWNWKPSRQAEFRRRNFSFVFQQTNLIENFSIIENLCIPLMIQGYSYEDAAQRVTAAASQMNLDESLLGRKSTAVSGGQLQRAAFTRALSTDFHVLFGDEPTGNLDAQNSRNLIALLKKNLEERQASAVVVSHDVALAREFADCTITVRKDENEGKTSGVLDNTCLELKA